MAKEKGKKFLERTADGTYKIRERKFLKQHYKKNPIRRLSEQQKTFCKELLWNGGNPINAVKSTYKGLTKSQMRAKAFELLDKAPINNYIKATLRKSNVTPNEIMDYMADFMRNKEIPVRIRFEATKELAKIVMLYKEAETKDIRVTIETQLVNSGQQWMMALYGADLISQYVVERMLEHNMTFPEFVTMIESVISESVIDMPSHLNIDRGALSLKDQTEHYRQKLSYMLAMGINPSKVINAKIREIKNIPILECAEEDEPDNADRMLECAIEETTEESCNEDDDIEDEEEIQEDIKETD